MANRHMRKKQDSGSVGIRKMQRATTKRLHLTSLRMTNTQKSKNNRWGGRGWWKGNLVHCCGNVNQVNHHGGQVGDPHRPQDKSTI